MTPRHAEYEEGLATLAEGGVAPETEAHVQSCTVCAARLVQLRRLVAGARLSVVDVPADLLARAQGLMAPAHPRRWIARLMGSSLQGAGARKAVPQPEREAFSLHLKAGEHSIRLQCRPMRDGWEILGRAPSAGWRVIFAGEEIAADDAGRFRLLSGSLDEATFELRGEDLEITVPSIGELLAGDA